MPETLAPVDVVALLYEAEIRLVKELGSFLVGEPSHRSVSLVNLDGVVLASSSPDHIGNAEMVARAMHSAFPSMGLGDAAVLSDPSSGSAHVQDHWLAAPIVHDGVATALVLVQAHFADVGGQAFGNYWPFARDVWQEGVVTTPVLVARRGQMERDVVETLKLNSRVPVLTEHDLGLMFSIASEAAALLPREPVVETATQVDGSRELVQELSTSVQSEVQLSKSIHNCAGEDGHLTLRLAPGRPRMVVDFTGSSQEVQQGFINATLATTRSAIARAVIDYTAAPANSGVLDALDIRVESTSFLDASPSLAVGWSPFEPGQAIVDLLKEALSVSAEVKAPHRIREAIHPPVRIDWCGGPGCRF